MGRYIQGPWHGKAEMLVEKYGARKPVVLVYWAAAVIRWMNFKPPSVK